MKHTKNTLSWAQRDCLLDIKYRTRLAAGRGPVAMALVRMRLAKYIGVGRYVITAEGREVLG